LPKTVQNILHLAQINWWCNQIPNWRYIYLFCCSDHSNLSPTNILYLKRLSKEIKQTCFILRLSMGIFKKLVISYFKGDVQGLTNWIKCLINQCIASIIKLQSKCIQTNGISRVKMHTNKWNFTILFFFSLSH
jgi:hypothetical protein